jgi:DNA-binding response OmpR family regulator
MYTLNVIALGNENRMQRIAACVSQSGINIIAVSQLDEALKKLRNEVYDVILIDSANEKAELFCQSLNEVSSVPVILLIAGAEANWPNYCYFKVDGFLSEESSNAELAARIKAFSRRKTKYKLESEINLLPSCNTLNER